jgi:hemoglobin-like flavoprotein
MEKTEKKPAFPPKVRQQPNPKPGEQRTYIQDPNKKPAFPPKVRQQPNPVREAQFDDESRRLMGAINSIPLLAKSEDEVRSMYRKLIDKHPNIDKYFTEPDFIQNLINDWRKQSKSLTEAEANKSKITKQDLIRIINEEINIALDEMYDPVYDSMIPEILTMLAAGGVGVKAAISHLKSKGLDKQAIIDLIKKAQSKLK